MGLHQTRTVKCRVWHKSEEMYNLSLFDDSIFLIPFSSQQFLVLPLNPNKYTPPYTSRIKIYYL